MPIPTIDTFGQDFIVEFHWTTASTALLDIWTSEDTESWNFAASEPISAEESSYSTNYITAGWEGLYIKVDLYGDGVVFPTDTMASSAYMYLPVP